MPAKTPEDICRLFRHYMAEGDLDSVLSIYDPEAVFLNQAHEVTKGREGLRREPQPMRMYAIEVARRQPDGSWCWLIGDPFTVGREVGF